MTDMVAAYSVKPQKIETGREALALGAKVRAFRQKSWMVPKVIAPVIHIPIAVDAPKEPAPFEMARAIDPLVPPSPFPRIHEIQKLCCQHFNISMTDLISHRRQAELVRARQVAMYLAKILTPHSYPEIGRRFGKRDHTTALWAVRKIERLKDSDPLIGDAVTRISAVLSVAEASE